MKRLQLIEYGIISIGLISGYKFLENVVSVIFQLAYAFSDGLVDRISLLLPVFVLLAVYGLCFVILIRKSGQIATWLQGNTPNDHIAVQLELKTLLYIILIGIMIFSIIKHSPKIIYYLFESFKNEISSKNLFTERATSVRQDEFVLSSIQVIFAFLAIYFARNNTGLFICKNATDALTFQSESETKEECSPLKRR